MAARPYEQTIDVEIPELVTLTYTAAGVGSRVAAGMIDLAICVALFLAVIFVGVGSGARRSFAGISASGSWIAALMVLAQFALIWGYYVLFEGLMDGQTPGKRMRHLRVVAEGGYSVTLGISAVRNLVRVIDMQPVFFYLVGLTSLLVTRRGQRLGDLVAGTIVVREEVRARAAIDPGRAAPGAPALQTVLTEDEFALLARLVERWYTLDGERRLRLVTQLEQRFRALLPEDGRAAAPRLLDLHAREQLARGRGVASRGETGAGRTTQALISAGQPEWASFAARLALAQRKGLPSLGERGVSDFVGDYRTLAADLARLRTASAGRALDELFYLGRLVAGAHNLLYRDRALAVRGLVRLLFTALPREVRRAYAPITLAALLLFGPAAVAAIGVQRDSSLAARLLPPAMLQRADDGVRRARDGEGYIDDPQLLRPVMASSIVTNNVQVTFVAFAGGVTAGIVTLLVLVANGISIGSVMGLYASKGIFRLLLAFVAPHGVLELFAICVAGGGGFLIAAALLIPGARTRQRALVENGRRAIHLIGASTFLLIIAGTLEGFVSPIEWWPLEGKLAVSGASLLFLVFYLRGGRKRATEPFTARLVP